MLELSDKDSKVAIIIKKMITFITVSKTLRNIFFKDFNLLLERWREGERQKDQCVAAFRPYWGYALQPRHVP